MVLTFYNTIFMCLVFEDIQIAKIPIQNIYMKIDIDKIQNRLPTTERFLPDVFSF